jgi:hypothetical protein
LRIAGVELSNDELSGHLLNLEADYNIQVTAGYQSKQGWKNGF